MRAPPYKSVFIWFFGVIAVGRKSCGFFFAQKSRHRPAAVPPTRRARPTRPKTGQIVVFICTPALPAIALAKVGATTWQKSLANPKSPYCSFWALPPQPGISGCARRCGSYRLVASAYHSSSCRAAKSTWAFAFPSPMPRHWRRVSPASRGSSCRHLAHRLAPCFSPSQP